MYTKKGTCLIKICNIFFNICKQVFFSFNSFIKNSGLFGTSQSLFLETSNMRFAKEACYLAIAALHYPFYKNLLTGFVSDTSYVKRQVTWASYSLVWPLSDIAVLIHGWECK